MVQNLLNIPPRLEIARTKTPLHKLERLSDKLGVEIYLKRDDLTGSELSGNKVRKLEFLLADAKAKGADTVITCGGAQSNHCRATALAAARCGLKSVLLLRTANPKHPPEAEGNILLDKMAGAEIVWITPEEYANRFDRFEQENSRLQQLGRTPYIIPEGGSNHIGSWGYVLAMEEIATDMKDLKIDENQDTTVLSATGSGGTTAGLLLGKKMLDVDVNVVGVNVCDNEEYFVNEIHRICEKFCLTYQVGISVAKDDICIIDGYVGDGYALSRKEELQAIYDLAKLEGIVLDPVYTGKAYYAMISEISRNKQVFGKRVIFVHTGGLFGLFPVADQLTTLFK